MAKLRWNCTSAKPSPLLAANISLITIRMIPMDSACRIPVTICGLAERSTRCHSRAGPPMPYDRQVSARTSSTDRTPSTVLSRIGHTQPLAITITFMVSPMPANRMMTGTSTGGGMARKNSSTGSSTARTRGIVPTSVPTPTPAATATPYPTASRARLGSTSARSRCPVQTSPKVRRMSRSGGK